MRCFLTKHTKLTINNHVVIKMTEPRVINPEHESFNVLTAVHLILCDTLKKIEGHQCI
jgi:hypothetical protein